MLYIWRNSSMSVAEAKFLNNKFWQVDWLFNKIGWLLERTPVCVCFCGFWISCFIPKWQKLIALGRAGKITEGQAIRRARWLDFSLYFFWICFVLVYFILVLVLVGNISIWLLPFTVPLLHEPACPSSVRIYKKAKCDGQDELAKIINWAGPSITRYLKKNIF